jgi:hypothetical protein
MPDARRRTPALAGIGACTAGILAACLAQAEPETPLSVTWDAPAGCPDADAMRASLRRWVEASPERMASAGVTASAHVERVTSGWRLDLALVTPSGKQEESLVTERCETFVELVALKVALAVDPMGLVHGIETTGQPASEAADMHDGRWALRAVFGLGAGLLPGVAESVSGLAGYEVPGWRFEAGGGSWFPRRATYATPPGVGADLSLWTAGARACALPELGGVTLRVTFPVCGGGELGQLSGQGEGVGVADVKTSRQLWAALTVGPGLRFRLAGPLFFWLEGDFVLALTRPAFHVRNLPQLYETTAASARGWAGLEVRFGADSWPSAGSGAGPSRVEKPLQKP